MSESLGRAVLDLAVDSKGLTTGLASAEKDTLSRTQRMGEGMKSVGTTMTKTVTPAAAVLGAAMFKMGKDYNDGVKALRVGTGATGEALDGLTASAKNVAGTVTQSFSEVAQVMADLNTRTGATGPTLEAMTKQILDLSEITGTDAVTNVEKLTRVLGDQDIAAEDSAAAIDMLFRASQETGVGVDKLADSMVQFGAPMRNLGFSFEQSAALLSNFEKAGVNTEAVMSGLKIGIGKLAKEGENVPETFNRVVSEIENAGSASEATGMAIELFGQRAGPDLADAIRGGKFEISDLTEVISGGSETIAAAREETLTLTDKMTMMKNSVAAALGPFGEMGGVMFGAIAAIGPLVFGLGSIITAMKGVKLATIGMLGVWGLIIVAVIALVVIIVKNWDTIKAFVLGAVQAIWDFLKAAWEAIKAVTLTVWTAIKDFFVATWEAIKGFVLGVWEALKTAATTVFDAIKAYFTTVFDAYKTIITTVWDAIKTAVTAVWDFLKATATTIFDAIKAYFTTVFDAYKTIILTIWEAIKTAVTAVWNALKLAAETVFNALKAFFSTVMGAIQTVITTVWNAIKTAVTTVWDALKSAASTIWNGIQAVIETVSSAIQTAIQGAIDIFNTLMGVWEDVKAAASAVKDFVIEKIEALAKKVKGIIDGIVEAFKKLPFVPGSPIPLVVDAEAAVSGVLAAMDQLQRELEVRMPELERTAGAREAIQTVADRTTSAVQKSIGQIGPFYTPSANPAEIADEIAWKIKVGGKK